MSLYGKLNTDGTLSDIQTVSAPRTWADGSTDVLLKAPPPGFGKVNYDAVNQVAISAGSPRTLPQLRAALHALAGAAAKLLPSATAWATTQDDEGLHTLAADAQANTTKAEILVARWLQVVPNGAIAVGVNIRGVQ